MSTSSLRDRFRTTGSGRGVCLAGPRASSEVIRPARPVHPRSQADANINASINAIVGMDSYPNDFIRGFIADRKPRSRKEARF